MIVDSFGDLGSLVVFFPKCGAVLPHLLLGFLIIGEHARVVAHDLIGNLLELIVAFVRRLRGLGYQLLGLDSVFDYYGDWDLKVYFYG